MNLAILSDYFKVAAPTERLNEVRQLVFRIKDAFFEAVHSSSWLTSSARTRLLDKLEEMEVLVGSPGDRLEPEFVERFYKPLHDVPVNRLFSSWIEGRRLNTHYRWKDQKTMFYDEERVRTFLMGSNTAVITSGQVHRPFIYEYGPPALNYAGMGMTIGHILMRGFDDAHLGGQFWSGKDLKKEYAKRTLCLRRSHRSLLSLGGQHEVLNDVLDSETLADFEGTKFAYAAYDALPEEDRSVKLAGFIASSDQLFFINLCAGWCAKYASPGKNQAPYRSRCIVPLKNMPEFSRAFGCDAGTPMNPDEKCTFW
ncbi:neprilysin-1-like [Rhipicephalus microplus]|uniref:neprilysin-1-like n=1 Tax=Rhipicephalus microplus TaxID=6941 RepID=UPI003F6D001C